MANLTYKSGDAARMLGISQETIRYYEKCGIILSDKTEENGYRCFRFRNLLSLVHLRLFRRLNFPIQDAWKLVNGETIQSVSDGLIANERLLADQIELMTQMLDFSAQMQKEVLRIPENLYHFTIRQAPGYYHIKFQNNKQIIKNKLYQQVIKTWYEKSPAVQAGILAPLDALNPEYQAEVGFIMQQDHFERWIDQVPEAVHFIPGGRALYCVAKVEPDCIGFYEPMQPIIDYVNEQHLPVKNIVYAIPLAMRCRLDPEQPMKDYYQVYVPLAEEGGPAVL